MVNKSKAPETKDPKESKPRTSNKFPDMSAGLDSKKRYAWLKKHGYCVDACGRRAAKDRSQCAQCVHATAARTAARAKKAAK